MPDDTKAATFPIRRILLDMSPPKVAHGFAWARVGDQFQIEFGYFDLKVMGDMIVQNQNAKMENPDATPTEGGLDLFITDRFVMDIASTGRLVDLMRTLAAEYENVLEKIKAHAG